MSILAHSMACSGSTCDLTLNELKLYMTELIGSQTDILHKAIADLKSIIKTQSTKIKQLKSRVATLENQASEDNAKQTMEMKTLEVTIQQLNTEINNRDQALLSNDIEIAGCPEVLNENGVSLVLAIAKKIGVGLEETDVVSVERAGAPRAPAPAGEAAPPPPACSRGPIDAPRAEGQDAAGGENATQNHY